MSINREALQDDARLGLSSTFWFGKYKDRMIEEICSEDPKYLEWCIENIKGFVLSNDAYKMYEESIEGAQMDDNSHYGCYGDAGDPSNFGDN
jgi:hypothetical protein